MVIQKERGFSSGHENKTPEEQQRIARINADREREHILIHRLEEIADREREHILIHRLEEIAEANNKDIDVSKL